MTGILLVSKYNGTRPKLIKTKLVLINLYWLKK